MHMYMYWQWSFCCWGQSDQSSDEERGQERGSEVGGLGCSLEEELEVLLGRWGGWEGEGRERGEGDRERGRWGREGRGGRERREGERGEGEGREGDRERGR